MKLRSSAMPAAVVSSALILSACGSDGAETSDDGGPTISVAMYPLVYAAERVAGDNAEIVNLTTPGVEPHDLELTGRQVGEIADADLVVYLREFQPAVDSAVDQNATDSALDALQVVHVLGEGDGDDHDEGGHEEDEHDDHEDGDHEDGDHEDGDDDHDHEEHDDHDHGPTDPHVWLNPINMIDIGNAIADRMAEIDPGNADEYHENAGELAADMGELDGRYQEGLASCERRVFVTSHEAFGYLAERYDLEQVGIGGIDPEAEPSPERIAEVHDVATDRGVTTIFYERLVSPEVAETLANDLGVEAAVLDPIEGLTDDTANEDYLSLMQANLDALRAANGCS